MAQTFDIRFARTAGLAAMLEVPENAFRWKGGGLLKIDSHGISISVKRGLLALFAGKRTHRISTEDLRTVYREGDALRVEFLSGTSAHVVLPFWANDRDTAAQIVRLLPTSRTVEIEDATSIAKPRTDRRVLLSLAAAVAAIAVGSWAVYPRAHLEPAATPAAESDLDAYDEAAPAADASIPQREDPAPAASPGRWYEAPAIPLNPSRPVSAVRPESVERPEPSMDAIEAASTSVNQPVRTTTQDVDASPHPWVARASSDGIVPIVPGMPAYAAARRQLDLFLAECNTLRGYYLDFRDHLSSRQPQDLQGLWWRVTVRVSNSWDFEDPALKPLQEIELAVSRAWRGAYSIYANPELASGAPAEFEFAEMLEARASQFVQ